MTFGSLFAGIGGFDLGLERAGMKPLWQVEKDEWCQKILKKHWPEVKRYGDIREVHGIMAHAERKRGQSGKIYKRDIPKAFERREAGSFGANCQIQSSAPCPTCLSPVDLICGGFPCQPFSVAGKQRGKEDDRYLWPEMLRVITEIKPRWVIGENVTGILHMGFNDMLSDLETAGYEVWPLIIPACAVNAPHRRDRVWIVAYATTMRSRGWGSSCKKRRAGLVSEKQEGCAVGRKIKRCRNVCSKDVANGNYSGRKERCGAEPMEAEHTASECGGKGHPNNPWSTEPDIYGIPDEFSKGLDKVRLNETKRHDRLVLPKQKGVLYAKTKNARPRKILQKLSEKDVSKKVQFESGRFNGFQEKEVLQSILHGSRNDAGQSNPLGSKKKSLGSENTKMRILWNGKEFKCSSHGFKPNEQQKGKHKDFMLFMSHLLALDSRETQVFDLQGAVFLQNLREGICEGLAGYVPTTLSEVQKIWQSASDKEKDWLTIRAYTGNPFHAEWPGIPRVAQGVKNRVDRLRGLGNAVVPQIPEIIGRIIMEIEGSE